MAKEVVAIKYVRGDRKQRTAHCNEDGKDAVQDKNKSCRRWLKALMREQTRCWKKKPCTQDKTTNYEMVLEKKKESQGPTGSQDWNQKILYSIARSYRKGNTEHTYAIKDKNMNLLVDSEGIDNMKRILQ